MSRDAYVSGGLARIDRLARRGSIFEPRRRRRFWREAIIGGAKLALYLLALALLVGLWVIL